MVQDEGQVGAHELQDQGHGVGECWEGTAGPGASHPMKWGPYPHEVSASSEGLSILAAAEDTQYLHIDDYVNTVHS